MKPTEPSASSRITRWHVAMLFTLGLGVVLAPMTGSAAPGSEPGPPIAVQGRLEVIVEDDLENQRFQLLHFIEDEATGQRFQLRFEGEPPGQLKSGAIVQARGRLRGEEIILAADGDGSSGVETLAAAVTGTFGEQRTLVMVADFLDRSVSCSVDAIRDLMFTDPGDQSVDDLYQETSFGDVWFTGSVAGPYPIDFGSSPCNVDAWANAVDEVAMADGVNLEAYDRKVYVVPPNACFGSGVGTVGGNPSRAWIFRCDAPDNFAHELGHNLGMGHAATPSSPYGDTSDIMGIGGRPLRQVNAPHKEQMGWLRDTQVQTLTESGLYEVAPLEVDPVDASAPQALKIFKADTGDYYYLSYRRAIGFDANLSGSQYVDALSVHHYPGDGSASKTYAVATLADNESFVDATNGITITQLSHLPDGSTFSVTLDGASTDPCAGVICQNGGSCEASLCVCVTGFTGEVCEINIDDCTPNPCQNGGMCLDGVSSYACECIDGYAGTSCETPPSGANQPPVVSLSVSTTSGQAPLDLAMGAAASDSDGEVVGYDWSFGDGSSEDTTTNATSHTYIKKGRYNLCVTVTDEQGATGKDCVKIRVVSKGGVGASKGKGNNKKALTLESAPSPDACDVSWEFFAIDMDDARTAAGAWKVVEDAVLTRGDSRSKSGRLRTCVSFEETFELCSSLGDGGSSCWSFEVDAVGDLDLLEGDAERFMPIESNITEDLGPTELVGGCSATRTGRFGLWDLFLLVALLSLRPRRQRRRREGRSSSAVGICRTSSMTSGQSGLSGSK